MKDHTTVFVSGMFRSGTTLLARMLNAHPAISFASDPLRPMINSFRSDVLYSKRTNNARYAPLNDYFLSRDDLHSILNASLAQPFRGSSTELLSLLKSSALPYSPLWAKNLDESLNFSLYTELLEYALNLIKQSYPANDHRVTGFKEVWATEFCGPLLSTLKNSKAIIIIRDPRAIVASKNSTVEPYPIFFMARQWRKISFISEFLKANFQHQTLVIRYEDLITDPESTSIKMCKFIGIEFDDSIIDTGSLTDGEGKHWQQNSSYSYKDRSSFQKQSIDAWKTKIGPEHTHLTELICGDWMNALGYDRLHSNSDLLSISTNSVKRYSNQELAEWIRPYSFDDNNHAFSAAMEIEKLRLHTVTSGSIPLCLKDSYQVSNNAF